MISQKLVLHCEVKANLDRMLNDIYVVDTLLQQRKTPDICNDIWAGSHYQKHQIIRNEFIDQKSVQNYTSEIIHY